MLRDKKLHFLHIPKTGGTTLNYFLEKQFKMTEICPFSFLGIGPPWGKKERILKNLPDDAMRKYNLFQGHLGWIPRIILSDDEIETITILRHPVSRIISLYNYLRGSLIFWTDQPKRWSTFDDFVYDDTMGLISHSNTQTKFFCADLHFKHYLSHTAFTHYIAGTAGAITQVETQHPKEELLKLAIERLHRCSFVGLTEHYDESFKWLCAQYNWLPPKTLARENASIGFVKKDDISTKTLDRIIEFNQLDIMLYHEASKIFEDRRKTRVHCNIDELENAISHKIARNEIKFSFDDVILGEAWHTREGSIPNVFCWSSSPISTLLFALKKRCDHLLSFRVPHWLSQDFTQTLTLTVNKHPIRLVHQLCADGDLIFTGIIPAQAFRKDNLLLELIFSIPKVIRPIDMNPDALDIRELGFACKEVHIKAIKSSLFTLSLKIFDYFYTRYKRC